MNNILQITFKQHLTVNNTIQFRYLAKNKCVAKGEIHEKVVWNAPNNWSMRGNAIKLIHFICCTVKNGGE